jgi:hypothetical protein
MQAPPRRQRLNGISQLAPPRPRVPSEARGAPRSRRRSRGSALSSRATSLLCSLHARRAVALARLPHGGLHSVPLGSAPQVTSASAPREMGGSPSSWATPTRAAGPLLFNPFTGEILLDPELYDMSSARWTAKCPVHVLHLNRHRDACRRVGCHCQNCLAALLLDSVDCISGLTIVSHQGSRHVALAFSEDGCPLPCGCMRLGLLLVLTRAQELQSTCINSSESKQPAVCWVWNLNC